MHWISANSISLFYRKLSAIWGREKTLESKMAAAINSIHPHVSSPQSFLHSTEFKPFITKLHLITNALDVGHLRCSINSMTLELLLFQTYSDLSILQAESHEITWVPKIWWAECWYCHIAFQLQEFCCFW